MRPHVQISFVPDGPITRVHVAAFDLDRPSHPDDLFQLVYDSGIEPPDEAYALPHYVEMLLRQLRARVMVDQAYQLGEIERHQRAGRAES